MSKTCIVIAGPTAIGKTDLAVSLAQRYSTSIISADSRQCYQEMSIGVAKPSAEILATVPHYFINSHSIQQEVTAAGFEAYALDAAGEVFRENDIVIIAGGSGLYIRAFLEGLDEIPQVNDTVRKALLEAFHEKGIGYLQEAARVEDPLFFASGEIQNPQRLVRALEVKRSTGRSVVEFRSGEKKKRPFDVIFVALELPRDLLYDRINRRVDQMMAAGLEEEARSLLPYKHLNALQTVGYRELFDYFEGKLSLDRAVELIKQNTRHYAKRQLTWFKKQESVHWIEPDFDMLMEVVNEKLNR